MAILDTLLGDTSSDLGAVIGTNPAVSLGASDILHAEPSLGGSTSFTGVGSLDLGLSAPTVVGVNSSIDHTSDGGGGGGLLGGIL
jgi:hypothetical protein